MRDHSLPIRQFAADEMRAGSQPGAQQRQRAPRTAWKVPVASALSLPAAGGAVPLGRAVIVSTVLAAMPQANRVEARPAPSVMAMLSAQATGVTRADAAVPDASTVLAGHEAVTEEPAPTF